MNEFLSNCELKNTGDTEVVCAFRCEFNDELDKEVVNILASKMLCR